MALFKWDDSLNVGIKKIDDQHRMLIDMLNEFYENIKSKSTKEILADLIKNMKEYVAHHFSTEEELLRQHGYPDFEKHKSEHKVFINKVEDFENRFNAGRIILSFEITNFFKSWLRNHIQVADKSYSKYLISKGVK